LFGFFFGGKTIIHIIIQDIWSIYNDEHDGAAANCK